MVLLSVILFTLYFSPYLINGKDTYVLIHDNLDQINSRNIFDGTYFASFLPDENINRVDMPGVTYQFRYLNISIASVFYKYLGYFWGFVLVEILYRVIGFLGMFFLLKKITITKSFPNILLILISFAFVSLPFWPQGHLSVTGIPLIILLFYNLYNKEKIFLSFSILFLFPFFSSFALSGIFILMLIGISILYFSISNKRINISYFLGIGILTLSYILVNYELFMIQFIDKTPTNRLEIKFQTYNFKESLLKMKGLFLNSQYHAYSLHFKVILPTIVLVSSYLLLKNKFLYKRLFYIIITFLLFASFFYGIFYYDKFYEFYLKLNFGLNLSRFYLLSPSLWYIVWALVLINLYHFLYNKKVAFVIIFILSLIQIGYNSSKYTLKAYLNKPTFSDIMSVEQFDEIASAISYDKQNERIGCIGFYPSIANYNGFKTIGGYRPFYNLDFKHDFYKIINNELDQNKELKSSFQNWGGRAYLFDNDLPRTMFNEEKFQPYKKEIISDLDITELKKQNISYLFSISKILNANEIGLEFVYKSKNTKFLYNLFIYKIIN